MKKLDKATRILAKLMEVAHWIAAASMALVLVLSLFMGADVVQKVSLDDFGASLSSYGFEIMVNTTGQVSMTALRLFCVGSVIILSLMAMVFRNIWLILKRSENLTPFQKDNVRMVREIGIFLLSVPTVSLVMIIITRAAIGPEAMEGSGVGLGSFMVGLAVLCLSQIFARGVELEEDTAGLL